MQEWGVKHIRKAEGGSMKASRMPRKPRTVAPAQVEHTKAVEAREELEGSSSRVPVTRAFRPQRKGVMLGQHRGVLCSIVQGDESAATSIVLVAGGHGRSSLQPCKHVGDKQDPQAKATSSMYHSLWVARSWSPEVEGAKTQQECRTTCSWVLSKAELRA